MIPSLQDLAQRFSGLCGPPPAPAQAVATPPAEGTPIPAPPPPVQIVDYAAKGFHFDVSVPPDRVVAAASILDQQGFAIDTITGVDWIAENQMEVVYDFFHPEGNCRAVLRARIDRQQPEIPTISDVFPGADWHERETHDFFGIRFVGHPDLSPLLLPEDADYHPLCKDFSPT